MKCLSMEPDDDMKWIYDPAHPDYYTDKSKHLREARAAAIQSAPEWMIREAEMNDTAIKESKT